MFAPAEDGGYVLIGVSRCDAQLFQAIAWSTAQVMERNAEPAALDSAGSWQELETLWDVDTPDDYRRLVASGLLER